MSTDKAVPKQDPNDVLRRMLNTPPQPHVAKAKPKKLSKKPRK